MNKVYQIINARYRTLSRFARRSEARAGRTKRNIFLGSLRISPNSAHPHRMTLAQLKAVEKQVREHHGNHDIVILDDTGSLISPDEIFGAASKEKAPEEMTAKELWEKDSTGMAVKAEHMKALATGDDKRVAELEGTGKADKPDAPAAEPEKDLAEEPPEEPEPEDAKDEEEPALEEDKVEATEYDMSILDGSVAKLEEALEEIGDEAYLAALLTFEKDNKNRKGAAAAIEEQLAFVRGEG